MPRTRTSDRKAKGITSGPRWDKLIPEISHLPELDGPALRQRWRAVTGDDPGPNWGRSLLLRALAYRLQERSVVGLKPSTQRLLDRVADSRAKIATQDVANRRPGAGTVLIREWGGVRHRVTVLDHEVVYGDRRYKSLSEVARAITGSRWSGPRFFGLTRRIKEATHD